jgi:hypothetical protein
MRTILVIVHPNKARTREVAEAVFIFFKAMRLNLGAGSSSKSERPSDNPIAIQSSTNSIEEREFAMVSEHVQ